MSRNFYVQPNYYVGEAEHTIAVAESGNFPGESVVVFSQDPEYFGQFSLDMPVEFMRLLAKTILKVCDEIEDNKE